MGEVLDQAVGIRHCIERKFYERYKNRSGPRSDAGPGANSEKGRSLYNSGALSFCLETDFAKCRDNRVEIRWKEKAPDARVQAGIRTVKVYDTKILPVASQNLLAARNGFTAGMVDFLRLIEAQRKTIRLQEKHQMAIAELHRRWAELERSVGGPVSIAPNVNSIVVPIEPSLIPGG